MANHTAKNYMTDNGDKLVIGGTLEFAGDAAPIANQADSTATTAAGLKEDFNALLAKLKASGLMAADSDA